MSIVIRTWGISLILLRWLVGPSRKGGYPAQRKSSIRIDRWGWSKKGRGKESKHRITDRTPVWAVLACFFNRPRKVFWAQTAMNCQHLLDTGLDATTSDLSCLLVLAGSIREVHRACSSVRAGTRSYGPHLLHQGSAWYPWACMNFASSKISDDVPQYHSLLFFCAPARASIVTIELPQVTANL